MQAYRNAQTLYTQLRRVARLMGVSAQVAVSLVIVDLARRHPAEAAALIALAYGTDYTLSRAGNVVRRRAGSVARGARSLAARSVRGAASSMRRSVRASPRRTNN
jgi:hypothetical protein